MNNQWLALGMAGVSLALLPGWYLLKERLGGDKHWLNISEQWRNRLAQFFYFVGIPYLAVIFGILTPQLLGLKGLEYFNLINWNSDFLFGQIQQAFTLMLAEWLLDVSATLLAGSIALLVFAGVWWNLRHQNVLNAPLHQPMLCAVYYTVHWAFYRAVFWAVTGSLYLGVVLGIGFVLLEWTLVSIAKKQRLAQSQPLLINAIILILTASIFFYSPNLWLLLPVHLVMVALVNKSGGMKYQWETAQ